jgi:SET domain-containing protein
MLLVSTYIAASKIDGVGVFAAEPIKTGSQIWRFDATFDLLIPTEKYLSSPPYLKQHLDRYGYPSPNHLGFIVYEADNGRFMNHSEKPNTDFSGASGGKAVREIVAGEELTCNYGDFFEDYELIPRFTLG